MSSSVLEDGLEPASGGRCSATFWAIELVNDRATREPLAPFNGAGPTMAPMMEVANACKAAGLWPFIWHNRMHVVPPCNSPVEDVQEGLAIIDEALTLADAHYTG